MLIRRFTYSAVTVDVVSMEPGECYGFDAKGSLDCVATLYVNGVIAPEDASAWAPIEKHSELRMRRQWGGWDVKSRTKGNKRFVAGPEGALWVCLSHVAKVEQQTLAGSLTIPAGAGFVVGSGDVILGDPAGEAGVMPPPEQTVTLEHGTDNANGKMRFLLYGKPIELGALKVGAQAGEIANFFPAIDVDREVTGNGVLLLVRNA